MKKVFIITALALGAACVPFAAFAAFDPDPQTEGMMSDQKVIDLSNKYIALLSSLYPEEATRAGTLGYHNALDQRDWQTQLSTKKTLLSLKEALEKVDPKKLSVSKQIDYTVLASLVNKKLFETDIVKSAAKDPLWYLQSVDAVYDILMKDFMSAPDRLRDGLKRLQILPSVLKEARSNLDNPPDIRVRLAMEKAKTAYDSFGNITYFLNKLSQDEYTRGEIEKASKNAKEALGEYADYLQQLMDKKDYEDFRLGEENYVKLMKDVYMTDIPVKKLQKILEKELDHSREQLITALTPVVEPAFTEEQKLERTNNKGLIEIAPTDYYLAAETFNTHPKYKEVLDTYAKNFTDATKFFNDKKIFPVGALKVVIAASPAYLGNKMTKVTYLPPFPLLNKQMGDVLVSLPEAKDADDILPKDFSYTNIKISAAENITPGKNLMYSTMPEEGQVMRKVSSNIFFINGWIKYSLNVALQNGYFDKDEEKLALAWYNYKKAVFALAGLKMQTKQFNYTQTLDFIIDSGIQTKEAETAADYLAINPLDAEAYVVGAQEFDRLKTKYQKKNGKAFDLADYHKKVLMSGKIPLSLLDSSIQKAYEKKESVSAFNMTYF